MKNMEKWVKEHSINGPSSVPYTGLGKNEIQLFYNIYAEAWVLLESTHALKHTVGKLGTYYVVFLDEYINYLKEA